MKKLGVVALALVGTGLMVVPRVLASEPARAATHSTPRVVMPATRAVTIVNGGGSCASEFCFSPGAVTIRQAQSVSWTDKSVTVHTVTRCTTAACPGKGPGTGGDPAFSSSTLSPGGSYIHTFHKTGTYNYYCMIHGFAIMHGTVTVLAFAVLTPSLPNGTHGVAYSAKLSAGGGKAPLHWSVSVGHLPSGLVLNGTTGAITGTPTVAGKQIFTVKLSDSSSPILTATRQLAISIS